MGLKDTAFFACIPSAYKNGKLFSLQPTGGSGDLDYSGNVVTKRNDSMGQVRAVNSNIPSLNYAINDGEVNGFPEMAMPKSRTNHIKYSENLDQGWSDININYNTGMTASINVTGDFGVNTMTETTTANVSHFRSQSVSGLTSGRRYWFSLYVKPIQRNIIRIQMSNSTDDVCQFFLKEQSVRQTDAGDVSLGGQNGRILKMPNGWFRISCAFVATASTSVIRILIQKEVNGVVSSSYTGETGKGFYLYGAQLESNPNTSANVGPGPLIATQGAAVTRTNPVLQSNAIVGFPEFLPITVYWEGRLDRHDIQQHVWSLFKNGGSSMNHYALDFNSNTNLRIRRSNLTTGNAVGTADYINLRNDYMKIVVIFKDNNNYALYINGFLIESFSGSFITFEVDRIRIGCGLTPNNDSGQRQSFKQLLMWNRELTEKEAKIHDGIFLAEAMATLEDKTLGHGMSKHWDVMRDGLDWFRKHNAKAYMVLLD